MKAIEQQQEKYEFCPDKNEMKTNLFNTHILSRYRNDVNANRHS